MRRAAFSPDETRAAADRAARTWKTFSSYLELRSLRQVPHEPLPEPLIVAFAAYGAAGGVPTLSLNARCQTPLGDSASPLHRCEIDLGWKEDLRAEEQQQRGYQQSRAHSVSS